MSQRRFLFLCGCAALILVVGCAVFYVGGRWLESGDVEEPRGDLGTRFEKMVVSYNDQTYSLRNNLTTMLLMGVDRTSTIQPSGFRSGGQADFLMLLVFDHDEKVVRQLQIDRDTIAEITILSVLGKENGSRRTQICLSHGFGDGGKQSSLYTVRAVENLLSGVNVDMYMTFDIGAISTLNDALGGVTVTIEDDFSAFDAQMTPGATLRLTGKQAEIFTRSRMGVGDGTNASRMRRQRAFLAGVTEVLNARMSQDVNYIGGLFDQLEDIMVTNVRRGRLINEANRAYQYDILPVETPQGEYTVGSDGFVEFHADEASLQAWVMRTFYEPANTSSAR